jgi:dipeptidyl aminopeptidase/acylaminoacyl peptidase
MRTLESIPPYWEAFRKALYAGIGNPETQRDFLIETSPLFHADKIARPPIVLQGANDPRVIKPEIDDIGAAVTKMVYRSSTCCSMTRGTGSRRRRTRSPATAILAFLDTHLKGKRATSAAPAAP